MCLAQKQLVHRIQERYATFFLYMCYNAYKTPKIEKSHSMTPENHFSALPISTEVKRAVREMGFEEATSIQAQSIPLILQGLDVIGHSQTGTGKTAAFGIPIIERIDSFTGGNVNRTHALVLCPTRELAIQACEELRKFAKYKHGISVVPIYGGQHIDRQINSLKKGASVVVGTPGRVMDHMRRRTLKLENLSMIVLDEADEMLNMGFREDIETILQDVPTERQTILFSATMPPEILQITHKYQNEPQIVKMVERELTVPSIRQYYYEVTSGTKTEALARLLDYHHPKRALVFCNTKRMVDELVDALQFRGYAADGLHGDMKQISRDTVMSSFRSGRVDILIATDVAARGIDVDDIDAVFNYDLPQDAEYYIHRIGRTGRAGKSGTSYTFVNGRRQIYALRDIESFIKTKVELRTIPSSTEVNEVRSNTLVNDLKTVLEEGLAMHKHELVIDRLMEMDFTSIQIACAALSLLDTVEKTIDDTGLDELIKAQKAAKTKKPVRKAPAPSATGKRGYAEDKKIKTSSSDAMASYVLSVGLNDKVTAKHIMEAFTAGKGIPARAIGKISIHSTHTIVEIAGNYTEAAVRKMKGSIVNGKPVAIKLRRAGKK